MKITRSMFLALSLYCLVTIICPVSAQQKPEILEKEPTLAYTFKNLNHNRAIQNFYIGSSYIYITQANDSITYLSRCEIINDTAKYLDEMKLTNFGHGQILDMYTYNDKNYFYIGCRDNKQNAHFFSLEVARFDYWPKVDFYLANDGATFLPRFSKMNFANKEATDIGETVRVEAGGNSDYTIFRVYAKYRTSSTTYIDTVVYSIYKTEALNNLLDNEGDFYGRVDMGSSKAYDACLGSFGQRLSDDVTYKYFDTSCQGIDMKGNTQIYITGGRDGDTPSIAYMNGSGSPQRVLQVIGNGISNKEIEGVQIKDDKVYFVMVVDTEEKKNTQRIYYFSTCDFTCPSGGTGDDVTPPEPDLTQLFDVRGECSVTVSTPTATDDCSGRVSGKTTDPTTYTDQGEFIVHWTFTDARGNTSAQEQKVVVKDVTAPVIQSITPTPSVLWPPNHKMVPVNVEATVTDNCDAHPSAKIVSVTSNEPQSGTGDGDAAPDWELTGDLSLKLRAERKGSGKGRTYTITVQCTDYAGNRSSKDACVKVPHNK